MFLQLVLLIVMHCTDLLSRMQRRDNIRALLYINPTVIAAVGFLCVVRRVIVHTDSRSTVRVNTSIKNKRKLTLAHHRSLSRNAPCLVPPKP
jgi:hypothetical protein